MKGYARSWHLEVSMRKTLIAALLLLLPVQMAAAQDTRERIRTISVTGTGSVTAKPEIAEVQIGVQTEARTAVAALNANTAAMNALFTTLKNAGIAETDMQTSGFNVSPRYEQPQPGRPSAIGGYQVSNQVSVKVRELAKLGELLDQVVQGGANSVHGVRFSLVRPDSFADLARKEAMADAKRKAELLATEGGVKLGRIASINEGGGPEPRFQESAVAMRAAAPVPVAPGELTVRASLRVTWLLE
jgi:uncharacterized protein YggE